MLCALISFLLDAALCDLSIMSLCPAQEGVSRPPQDTGTPGYAGPDVFPVCQTAWGSSLDVSMSPSVPAKGRGLHFPEAFFVSKISKPHLNSMSNFLKISVRLGYCGAYCLP